MLFYIIVILLERWFASDKYFDTRMRRAVKPIGGNSTDGAAVVRGHPARPWHKRRISNFFVIPILKPVRRRNLGEVRFTRSILARYIHGLPPYRYWTDPLIQEHQ